VPRRPSFDAVLDPHRDKKSLRQELLPQDARDLLAWCFAAKISVNDEVPEIIMTAAEVRLDDSVKNICEGGDGFFRHGGLDAWRYFKHRLDTNWAVVFAWDCDGDPVRGLFLVKAMGGGDAS